MNWLFWLSVAGSYFLGICSGLILFALLYREEAHDLAEKLWEKEQNKKIAV